MIKKCAGCGALFQTNSPEKQGYVTEDYYDKAVVCKRCFRIKNYGDYQIIDNDPITYKRKLDKIKSENDLVLFLCDILNVDEDLSELSHFNGPVILVISKIDLLPKSVKDKKLKDYIKNHYNLDVIDIVFISSKKNYHIDYLMNMIMKYKVSNNVYVVGNTNAGKSSLINAFIKTYSNNDSFVTASMLPQTTLDVLNVKLNDDVTLIDTPGIVKKDNYLYKKDKNTIKTLTPKKEIKPKTYQMKKNQSIIIGDYARIDYLSNIKNSITIYLSNDIKVRRINIDTNDYLKNLNESKFDVLDNKDIVISGLCFCKITKACKVSIYTPKNVKTYQRDNLI